MKQIRRLAIVALLAASAGCMRYQAGAVPMPAPEETRRIGTARVTTVESAHFLLRDVRVTADSVTGWHDVRTSTSLQPPNSQRIALHRSQVRRFEQERIAVVRTGLVALVVAYVAVVAYSLRTADW